MNKPASSLESEMRISSKPVIAGLTAVGIAVAVLAEYQPESSRWSDMLNFALLLVAVSAIAWLLDRWRPSVGRWFTVTVSAAMVWLGDGWLGVPGFLTLMVIPTALAMAMLGFSAALILAIGVSLFIGAVAGFLPARLDPSTVAIVLAAIWGVLGVVYAIYRPVRQLRERLEEYLERAQQSLEQTREHKAELKQAMNNLSNANRQLALAGERAAALRMVAESAQREKVAFLANVSHELRTPLNMIVGLVDLMVESPETYNVLLSPKMEQDLTIVHRNCEHLSEMINDVLALTQMDAGRMALYRESVDLRDLIDEGVEAVHPLLDKKQLALQVAIPGDLPEVYCDRTRIRQVILNLVSNAARFTEEGGITIDVTRQTHHVLVSVTDTGPGVSPEDAKRVFEPYYQGVGTGQQGKGGSGLGLSISERFIKLHGGQMWLESEPGSGSAFFFTLPILEPTEHLIPPGHHIRADWVWHERAFRTNQVISPDQLVRPRVIICDDTGTLHPAFTHYSDEIEFVDIQSLSQAVSELQRCPCHALVLNTAGCEDPFPLVGTAVRKAPDTPVIACSVPQPVQPAMDAGAVGHLVKPVTRDDLKEALRSLGKPVRHILVVDDDPDTLELFSRMLHMCDSELNVVTASSGEQALDELHRTSPDMMLLDIVMPEVDGWSVLEAIEQDEGIADVPTFFVSAQDPADQPPVSGFFLATMDGGLPLSRLLRCSLEVSKLLLDPQGGPDLAPV
jgi:signal transduction histidine kinase/CheY-like chemotaxis protein